VNTPDVYQSNTIGELHRLVRIIAERRPELAQRAEKGATILITGKLSPLGEDRYEVVSSDDDGTLYLVDQRAESCTCKDYQHRAPEVRGSKCCKHRIAAWLYVKLGAPRPSARLARVRRFRPACVRRAQRLIGRAA
jgi:hypothetical protein